MNGIFFNGSLVVRHKGSQTQRSSAILPKVRGVIGLALFGLLLALFGLLMLGYIYGGYLIVLKLFARVGSNHCLELALDSFRPTVTVLVTVFNEQEKIRDRIHNIQSCDYHPGSIEILVASDGSTDGTDDLVTQLATEDPRIRLFRPVRRKGKTDTQNQAIATAVGEIIVFTDANTRFDPAFLRQITRNFANPGVGGVDGRLFFMIDNNDGVSKSQGFYWRQELMLRRLESCLGILAVASGACMAIRRSLFRNMQMTVGEDCQVPLDLIDQGYSVVHDDNALAYDSMEQQMGKEFRTRVRMTVRNWQGTWSYPQLLNPLCSPKIAFSLWSHKVLRWLSPLFLICWLIGSALMFVEGVHAGAFAYLAIIFVFLAMLGFTGVSFPGASLVSSFCLANCGFAVGLLKVIAGSKISSYR